ncbi:MAG: hypothetical protein Ct9H300mP27_03340 [Chloroflexota bacterium]|nr:MAG: hypothetical protein Ct9H300mP27_03340 [Chloroflexota bacterium]
MLERIPDLDLLIYSLVPPNYGRSRRSCPDLISQVIMDQLTVIYRHNGGCPQMRVRLSVTFRK